MSVITRRELMKQGLKATAYVAPADERERAVLVGEAEPLAAADWRIEESRR
jgi:hypothetical protein